ncbi:MAG: tetratricopeptide repeat protein [Prevotella sp.]|jgi:tetratricopeptide (TPR) repeat protein|uniref:Tetratricopeptide repeat protein n=1 Tax=Segatella cerevisiae TaxID=2053716 RepID=A0ABT1BTF5_9BACT|nr:tetratricopeptide repeat protein [Segatella cerevisiae]MCH3994056.1 tetratricopeptide repeat protein [Prevotella sp.]MCI1246366.1 tetratricopeptide repeat protein [Prevotella sp.]MCO6024356.1 tetratricopeptide repeat protein [Segatella cerevisiae]
MAKNKKQGSIDMDDTLNRSEATFIKNRKLLTWVVVAIIVIIGGIIAYHNLIAVPNENKASTELGRGQEYFDNEMYDKALNGDGAGYNGFLAIADNYGSTDAGNLANLYAGLCYANLNKWADALEYLKKYDAKGDQMVSPAAIGALGDAYAHNGQLDKAIDNFKKASEMADRHAMDHRNNSLSPTFLIKAGEILESQGKKDDALKIYQDIKKKYVNSALVQSHEIDKYIERASTK